MITMSKTIKRGAIEYHRLESVESYIDIVNGLIYPIFEDGNIDWDFEISLFKEEVSEDWFENLSKEDLEIVKKSLKNNIL